MSALADLCDGVSKDEVVHSKHILNLAPVRFRGDDRRNGQRMIPRRLPPHGGAGGGLGRAVVGDDGAAERAVECGEHAALDEVEGRRLAVARARQVAGDLPVDAASGAMFILCVPLPHASIRIIFFFCLL